ncbi:MAG: hypothetical protein ACRDT6_01530 [Micromonosporaceae bacterium]
MTGEHVPEEMALVRLADGGEYEVPRDLASDVRRTLEELNKADSATWRETLRAIVITVTLVGVRRSRRHGRTPDLEVPDPDAPEPAPPTASDDEVVLYSPVERDLDAESARDIDPTDPWRG